MKRREFLLSAGALSANIALPETAPQSDWRSFEVTTEIEVLKAAGRTRVWLPGALLDETPFQKTLSNTVHAPGGRAAIEKRGPDGLAIVTAVFPSGTKPAVSVTSRVLTRDYAVDFARPATAPGASQSELEYFRRSTKLLPTDGVVKTTAGEITAGARTDLEKARAIYEWIVDNTFRDPKTRGCGTGNIRFMLESRDLGGKCADLNALFVGLARAAGLAARDVYGVRLAKSNLGYKSLGAATEKITKAQHCRAEVYIGGYGWVPVDPADVRKVVLEEPPGNLSLDDALVKNARTRLFGSWEMNWMAYNFAHDVALPGSKHAPVGFFMYPQAETDEGRIDSLDPENFRYEITSKEITQRPGGDERTLRRGFAAN